MRKKFRLTPG